MKDKIPSSMTKPFYSIALYLYKLSCSKQLPIFGRAQVARDLERLHPTENCETICTEYYVGKLAKSLMVCFLGFLLGVLVSAQSEAGKLLSEYGTIARGSYSEGSKSLELEGYFETGERQSFFIEVGAKLLSEEEAESLARELVDRLPAMILADNKSLQEVTESLLLEESYEQYPFLVEWRSNRPDIVSSSGNVCVDSETGEQVVLTARIRYEEIEGMEWEQEIPVCVVRAELSEEELLRIELEEMLKVSELESRNQAEWKLPENYQGEKIIWKQKEENHGPVLCGVALLVAVLIFFLADNDLHRELEKKRLHMKKEYPDVVQKLTLYIGAGLSVRGAFQKIAYRYEQDKKEGRAESPIYEEMLYACRQLQTGVSEGAVYENFGKRTGLQEYVRLSSLLMQNLKRGNSTLLQRLREEVEKAYAEQLQNSRKLGEEAATKLLLPMLMLLAVVMLMIMIPAFSSMGA